MAGLYTTSGHGRPWPRVLSHFDRPHFGRAERRHGHKRPLDAPGKSSSMSRGDVKRYEGAEPQVRGRITNTGNRNGACVVVLPQVRIDTGVTELDL